MAPSRVFLVEDQVLLLISLLYEPLPKLIADDEEIPVYVRSGVVFGEAQVDSTPNVYRHLIEALVHQSNANNAIKKLK